MVVIQAEGLPPMKAGVLGGIAGGVTMPLRTVLGARRGHGRGNWSTFLESILPGVADSPRAEQFHAGWLIAGPNFPISIGLGVVYGFVLGKLPPISPRCSAGCCCRCFGPP